MFLKLEKKRMCKIYMSELVLPGTFVVDKPMRVEGTFVEKNKTFTSVIGMLRDGRVIPLKGYYVPRLGDYVIGVVSEIRFSGFEVDLNSPYPGNISARDTREAFEVGDVVSAKVRAVTEVNKSDLIEPRKFWGGRLMEVESVKVPRLIGRNGSMLDMLKTYCKCDVFVGKNGRAYLKGGNVALAEMAVLKISRESHLRGLTDRMKHFLEKESSKTI